MTNLVIEPEPAGAAFLTGAESDPIWPGPESAPGPRTSEAAQKSGRSATLPVKSMVHSNILASSSGNQALREVMGRV